MRRVVCQRQMSFLSNLVEECALLIGLLAVYMPLLNTLVTIHRQKLSDVLIQWKLDIDLITSLSKLCKFSLLFWYRTADQ